jgi:hypothetical protein
MNSIYKTRLYKSLSSQKRSSLKKNGRNTSSIRRLSSKKTIKSLNLNESSRKRKKYDFLLRHNTWLLRVLYHILKEGYIKSPNEIIKGTTKRAATSSEEPDAIFFSPVPHNFIYNDNEESFCLYLDYEKVLNHYNSYFINNTYGFKPLPGTYSPKMKKKINRCQGWETYHHNLDPIKYPNIEHTPCYRTYKQMMKLLNSLNYEDFINEEDGPEIGFMSPKISLNYYLKYIIVPDRTTLKGEKIFLKTINKTIDEVYKEMREITEQYGGKFIEVINI